MHKRIMTNRLFISLFWPLSALLLTILSRLFFSFGPEYSGGMYYILCVLFLSALTLVRNKYFEFEEFHIPLAVFILGVIILCFGDPLYENDHYRYLWEGRVFFYGGNPYIFPPNSAELKDIFFKYKGSISFDNLTTVYPPLALVWFGIAGIFPFEIALRIMMVLNSALVYILLRNLKNLVKPWHLIIVLPILQKEFIQAIHIDLFAFMFVLPILVGTNLKKYKYIVFLCLSFWTKLLGIAFWPFIIFMHRKKQKASFYILWTLIPISLVIAIQLITGDFGKLTGVQKFSEFWVWNPGFFNILVLGFDLVYRGARSITFYFFGGYLVLLAVWILYLLKIQKGYLGLKQVTLFIYCIFAGLMFFTPVYNGWYCIWFLIPAMLLRLNAGVFYAVFSVFCYTSYGSQEYLPWAALLTHIWFPISMYELFYRHKKKHHLPISIGPH